ncbi:MAG: thymidine kinase [bacterium]
MANLIFNYSAMNGGKTISLLQTAHSYEERGIKFILIKSLKDTKGEDSVLSRTMSKRKADIILGDSDTLLKEEYYKMYYNVRLILVDEVEMLSVSQIEELWTIAHLINIPVITYGLKSNFKGDIFSPGIGKLVALADEMKEVGSACLCACGKTATFNSRKVDDKFTLEGEVVVIDGVSSEVAYEPLCSDCYLKFLKLGSDPVIKLSNLIEKIK